MAKKSKADDIVFFLMPDGSKVSNDPRFQQEEPESYDDPSLGAKPLEKWDPKELKAEVERRNQGRTGDEVISLEGIKKKSELVTLLKQDDLRNGAAPGTMPVPDAEADDNDDDDE